MARHVRTAYRRIKKVRPELYFALKETRAMTSTGAFNRLKRKKVKPIIPLSELRRMARKASKKSKVPIRITRDMTEGRHGSRYSAGAAVKKNSDVRVRLHPVLQYYDKRHVKGVIGHELDHAKVMKRTVKRRLKRKR